MAAYRRVYDLRHLQADCQKPGSAPERLGNRVSATFTFFYPRLVRLRLGLDTWADVGDGIFRGRPSVREADVGGGVNAPRSCKLMRMQSSSWRVINPDEKLQKLR